MSQAIFDHALKDIGVSEIIGPKSHPRISLAIKSSANWLPISDGDVPWCGCIRGLWGIETGTGVPAAHYRAASWAKWGKAVPLDPAQWRKGDTVVMGRTGGNHVALFSHMKSGKAYCLGGNQSNAVTLAPFAVSGIWAVRR